MTYETKVTAAAALYIAESILKESQKGKEASIMDTAAKWAWVGLMLGATLNNGSDDDGKSMAVFIARLGDKFLSKDSLRGLHAMAAALEAGNNAENGSIN